jgi:molecular chaperone DnaK (HSP70)
LNSIVGIDLGTTNSLIGIMEAGFPLLLADKDGERLTPSVVHFSGAVRRSSDVPRRACARSSPTQRCIP